MEWSAEQAIAAAPDAQVAAAGKKLSDARHWRNLGLDGEAVWGECQGSAPYQVRVSLADLSAKCTCPSRKFPCKHAVGLLILGAQTPALFSDTTKPEWVSSWLAKREEAAVRKTKPAEERKPDADAQAKRAATRHERVTEGIDALDLWMADVIRNGLAELETKGPAMWEQQAARLVDAQAPALASRIRRLATMPGSTGDWTERVLGEMGRIALLTHAYRRIDELRPALQADVRAAIGWTLTEDEVHAANDLVPDDWLVLGTIVEDDERFRVQRAWLKGMKSGRSALILQFAIGTSPFKEVLMPGTVIDADLEFWPSAFPQRALIAQRRHHRNTTELQAHDDCTSLLESAGSSLAGQPWMWRFGAAIDGVIPTADLRGTFSIRDRHGNILPLSGGDHWRLLALSGGHPIGLTAEWDGYALTPLSAVIDGVFQQLARPH